MKRLTEEKSEELIMKQFELSWIYWVTYQDLLKNKDWLSQYATTEKHNSKWLDWLRVELKPYVIPFRLEKEVQNINLQYWLKIK